MTCECEDQYTGTTTRGEYTRGKEHLKDLQEKNKDSDFWRHCQCKHGGQIKKLKMDIIETFKGDALLRQVSEAVRIERSDQERLINRRKEYLPTTTN